ncbi:hypothetical protein RND71_044132 [Anisodus tanguticus]|uniref:ATPase AAA-type core domain-containing protein n=1 Tax=Anisodus tanguticus TaxID=243964 RepID=A0AAE1UNL0_9SOLA|nr:hypothetical protein RND71_044132 [Anisodus tanguticus]
MWVNKYKPKTTANIVGQTGDRSCANKLKFWLNNWHKNKDVKPAFSKFGPKGNDNGAGFKAALLSGCPGIGKTTTAHLVAKELDTKTKSALTRAYNKSTELLPYAGKDMNKKVKAKGKAVDSKSKKSQKNEFDDDDENDDEEFEEDDEDLPDF